MKVKMNRDDFANNNYMKNGELISNQYAIKSVTSTIAIITIIWILNIVNIFLVDKLTTTRCFVACVIVYTLGMLVCKLNDLSKPWIKYFILLWVVVIITIVMTFLTYHSVLACLLPIVYTSMYSSRKMMRYTYILTVCSIIISVYAGYYLGICDANMALLTGKPLSAYVGENGQFNHINLNDRLWWTLALFFVVPRSMICTAFTIVCSNIKKIINMNVNYAQKMENLAEIDGMTGLYNKSKYLDVTSGAYKNEEQIAVIFWDINYLKKINDTAGHEAGDKLIISVAESIKQITSKDDFGYRIGGDEFILIMRGGNEKSVLRKIQEWENILGIIQKDVEFPLSVSLGYAYGKGEDLENVINAADQMMYENKRIMHSQMEK